MPTPIDLTDKPLELSPEFVYQVGPDSADVYVAEVQGSFEPTNEKQLKDGGVIDSHVVVTAFSFGDAVLWQYSQDEDAPEEKKKAEAKSSSSSSKSSRTSASKR